MLTIASINQPNKLARHQTDCQCNQCQPFLPNLHPMSETEFDQPQWAQEWEIEEEKEEGEEFIRSVWDSITAKFSATANPSELGKRAAEIATQEWVRWGKGTVKEWSVKNRQILEGYWRIGVGWLPKEAEWWSKHAWSAAFISWVMHKAGAGTAFKYHPTHTVYVGAAKQNRLANNNNPFKAYRIHEIAPRIGDLVCKSRGKSAVTYDNVDKGRHISHCDIVVAIKPGQLLTIGGNVKNSVSTTIVKIDERGLITSPGYYAIVRVGT